MLSRLPITLAQLKAGNNSQKLKNEIRRLLHSLTNESHKFRLSLSDKLNLKNPNKNIPLGNLSIYYTWKKH